MLAYVTVLDLTTAIKNIPARNNMRESVSCPREGPHQLESRREGEVQRCNYLKFLLTKANVPAKEIKSNVRLLCYETLFRDTGTHLFYEVRKHLLGNFSEYCSCPQYRLWSLEGWTWKWSGMSGNRMIVRSVKQAMVLDWWRKHSASLPVGVFIMLVFIMLVSYYTAQDTPTLHGPPQSKTVRPEVACTLTVTGPSRLSSSAEISATLVAADFCTIGL